MRSFQDFFLCDSCNNKNFTRIHNFSLLFHGVNFSDELIYDRITPELYQCTQCDKIFTKDQIEEYLNELKKKRKMGTAD